MATTVAGVVGTLAGSAAAAPLTGAASIMSAIEGIAKPLIDLIPNEHDKLAAQAHLADGQLALAMAQIDQQNKIIQAASDNVKADPHSSASRAYFCMGITTLILVNYGVLPVINLFFGTKLAPFEIPGNVLWIFATIMLGFVGVPSVMETLKSVMGMPGDSVVNLPFGVKVGNKS